MIFGDDGKARVLGSGSLKIPGLTKLKNLLLVEGLTINLISVSQICDEVLIQFTKDKCIVYNRNHCRIMKGERTSNNFYLLTSISPCMYEIQLEQESLIQYSEHTRRSDCTITRPSSQKNSDMKARHDQMSSLCMEYSLPSCPKSQLSIATKLLELLHMDLMGSKLGESIERTWSVSTLNGY